MAKKLRDSHPPRGLLRLGFRSPLLLYRAHLGWLLGDRFLMLSHTGRKSGRQRQVVLEVVRHEKENGIYIVASGWGEKSDWFRNVTKNPFVLIQSGTHQTKARAVRLSEKEAELELRDYGRRHPAAFRNLAKLMLGNGSSGTDEDIHRLVQDVPLVAFIPDSKEPAQAGYTSS